MNTCMTESVPAVAGKTVLTDREKKRLRNAVARRKLEQLREARILQRHLRDVWDEPCPVR